MGVPNGECRFIVQALRGEPITVFGDGSQTRSFCYVDDLIEGCLRLMEAQDDVTGPINLGNPAEVTILELAEKVVEMTGSQSKIIHRPLPADDPKQRRPDISRARETLGWEPKVSLSEGMSATISYLRELLAGPAPLSAKGT